MSESVIGVDTGVKAGIVVIDDAGQVMRSKAINLTPIKVAGADKLLTALDRGRLLAKAVIEIADTTLLVAIDTPQATQRNGYTWGLQCALFAALYTHLEARGFEVFAVKPQTARALLGVSRGKQGILDWGQVTYPELVKGLPVWKAEAIAEAAMLARTLQVQRR